MNGETYQIIPEKHNRGMFYLTDCGNRMYYVDPDPMKYHGCLCPACFMKGKNITLYIRGSKEANMIMRERLGKDERTIQQD